MDHECDNGWIWAAPEYVDHVVGATQHTERAVANSVYPCSQCQPELFHRWAGGHLEPGHDPGCAECKQTKPGRRRRRPTAHVDEQPPMSAYEEAALERQERMDA